MLARFGVGVGEAGGTPPSASLIADLFGPLQRSLAFSIFALGAPLGAWLGSEFAGRIAEQYGWRAAFMVLGVPGVALALVILLTLREPVRGRLDGGAPSHAAPRRFKETLSYVWQRSSVFHVIAAGTMLTFWSWGLIWWTPAFLMRSHGLTVGEAGALLGPIHLIGGTGSLVVTAALMYLRAFRDPRRIMRFAALVALVATVPSILVYAGDRSLVVPMLWILIPATYFYIGPLTGVLQNLVPGGMRAQAMAILLFTANIANLVIAPQLLGFASDVVAATTTLGADSLRWVLAFTAPVGFWAAWHCWRAEATVREDFQAVISGGGLT
jgi:MFS family permease